jgi:hypothetical protein
MSAGPRAELIFVWVMLALLVGLAFGSCVGIATGCP